jgi:hypothetical protein
VLAVLRRLGPAAALVLSTGCAGLVTNAAADALSNAGAAYASDDDPQLVREALPFALKAGEGLLLEEPQHTGLLLALAAGFTQYAHAFVQADAEALDVTDPRAAEAIFARTRGLYSRARDYGLRALEVRHPGFRAALEADRDAAVAALAAEDVPFLYWTAAAWAALINISKRDLAVVAGVPSMETLMTRALVLDETFDSGAIHEFFISYDGGRLEASRGGVARARQHFERSMQLCDGKKVGPLVAWAETVAVGAQDRAEFEAMLERALSFDVDRAPRFRLANRIAQEHARRLMARADDLFVE